MFRLATRTYVWAHSSAGQSARLISVRSVVRSHLGPLFRSGAVAQLGERLLCKQEVAGSTPVSSINSEAITPDFCSLTNEMTLLFRYLRKDSARSGRRIASHIVGSQASYREICTTTMKLKSKCRLKISSYQSAKQAIVLPD